MLDLSLPNLYSRISKLEQRLATAEIWRGTYIPGTVYRPNDVVMYNGDVYISVAQNFNTLPTDTTKWSLLSNNQNSTNYAFNGDFQMLGGSGAGPSLVMSTGFTSFTPGWGVSKGAAADICGAQIIPPGAFSIDPINPAANAMYLTRTYVAGGGGNVGVNQWPIERIVKAMWGKTITITARIACTVVGAARLRYHNGSAYVNGAVNLTTNWETISLTIKTNDYSFSLFTAAGIEIIAGNYNAICYVSGITVVEGTTPVPRSPTLAPMNAGNSLPGAQASRAPVCSLNPGATYPSVGAAVETQIALPLVEIDTDYMSTPAANKITIRTPGKYFVLGTTCMYSGVQTTFRVNAYLNNNLAPKYSTYGYQQPLASWTALAQNLYQYCTTSWVDDLIEGDFLTLSMYNYYGTASFLFNGTQLYACRIGD